MWYVNVKVDRDITNFTNWPNLAALFDGQREGGGNTFLFEEEAQARGFAAEAEFQDERPEVTVYEDLDTRE